MISLLLLAISILTYKIAEKYYSRHEYDMVHFETKGSIIAIISLLFSFAAIALSLYNAYNYASNGS